MPRTKAQDAERKRIAYNNNSEYREKHKEVMRLKYHEKKARMASLRTFTEGGIADERLARSACALHGIEPPSPTDTDE